MRGHIHKPVRTMASGKETTLWYVVVDVGVTADGRRRQKWHGGFATRREAEVARAKIVSDLHAGSYVAPDRMTLADWVKESWLPMSESRIKPSTFDSYRSNMQVHVLPALGTRPLQQLTSTMLNALYAELLARGNGRGPLSPKTVNYIHTIVHKALADAVDAGVLLRNVAERAKPPRPVRRAPREIHCWEPEELAHFLDHLRGNRLEAAWRLAAMTGMRRGEILGLRWCDVDLDAARISVRHAVVTVAYAGPRVLTEVASGPGDRPRFRDSRATTRASQAAEARARAVERRLPRQRPRCRKGERRTAPPAELQPGVRAVSEAVRPASHPTTRPPPHARDHRRQGGRSREGDQRAARPRVAGVHAEAVRACDAGMQAEAAAQVADLVAAFTSQRLKSGAH